MSSALEQGAIFAGRYRVLRLIATGGMGAIYEVLHLETERRRALKVMLPGVLCNDELRRRFIREAKIGAAVDSDFIVDVVDAGIDEATEMPFLVMELLHGEDLGRRLKRLGRLDASDVVTYLYHAALALDVMHRASVVHRDVKPENLFLMEREDGPPRIKVLDFGIAKVVAECGVADATLGMGTPLYMAPEQYDLRAQLTGAADLYALGMVAYALLVGSAYWAEEASAGRLFALAAVTMRGPQEPASARAAARGVALPPAFDAWFAQITALDPARRFACASEAVRALADVFGLAPPSRPIPSSPFGWAALAPPSRSVPSSPFGWAALSLRSPSSPFGWAAPELDGRDSVRSLLPPERPAPMTVPSPSAAQVRAAAAAPRAPPRSLMGAMSLLGVGAMMLACAVFSVRLVGAPPTRSSANEPVGELGRAPAPLPPIVSASASAAPASAAPGSSGAAGPAASAVPAPARATKVRAPLHARD